MFFTILLLFVYIGFPLEYPVYIRYLFSNESEAQKDNGQSLNDLYWRRQAIYPNRKKCSFLRECRFPYSRK